MTATRTAAAGPRAALLLRTFGDLQLERVEADGEASVLSRAGKVLPLLLHLAVQAGRPVARAQLADLLWSRADEGHARATLRQTLLNLKRLLGDDALEVTREAVRLREGAVVVDRDLFLAAEGRGDVDAMAAHYRGAFCARLALEDAPEFQLWVEGERERLRRLLVAALRAVPASEAAGLVRWTGAFLRAEPDAEEAVLLAFDALATAGDVRGAREVLEAHRLRLAASGESLSAPLEQRRQRLARAATVVSQALPVRDGPLGSVPARGAGDPLAMLADRAVAREGALDTLLHHLELARQGTLQRMVVHAPAGMGKSRLLSEFEARLRLRGLRVVRVRLVPGMRAVPYGALAELVRHVGGLPGAIGIGEPSAATLLEFVPELREQFPAVRPAAHRGDDLRRLRAQAFADLVEAVAEDRLVAVLLDDEHHMDAESRAVFAAANLRRGLRLLWLATTQGPGDGAEAIHLTLEPLGRADVAALLSHAAAAPDAAWWERYVERLVDVSGGVPQRLLQAVRGAVAAGRLAIADGRWTAADPDALLAAPLPATSGATSASLPAPQRQVLALLALWRRPLEEDALLELVARLDGGTSADARRSALSELEALGLLAPRAGAWVLAHDSIADEVLGSLQSEARMALLRALVHWTMVSERVSWPTVEHVAFLCGEQGAVDQAGLLVRALSRRRALRALDLYGRPLARRVALAAGRPEWREPLYRSLGWWARRSRPAAAALSAAAAVGAVALAWLLAMLQPRLALEAEPLAELQADGVVEFHVLPRVAVVDGFGRRLDAYRDRIVVRGLGGQLTGDTAQPLHGGRVQFRQLAAREVYRDPANPSDTFALRFSGGVLLRPLTVPVRGAWRADRYEETLAPVELFANGQPVGADRRVTLAVGDSLRVALTFAYTTVYATANYIVGAAATWLPRETSVIRLAGLPSPVRDAWRTVHFTLAPASAPGHHHVVVAGGMEDTVDHLFSCTNWTVGDPVWHDGNDLVDLSEAAVQAGNARNRLETQYIVKGYEKPQSELLVDGRPRPRSRGHPVPIREKRLVPGFVLEVDVVVPTLAGR